MKRIVTAAVGLAALLAAAPDARGIDPQKILEVSEVRGGLVVVVGCHEPALLTGLGANRALLIHGLDRDPARVAAAREHLAEKGLYGRVTVSCWEGPRLPLVDQTVKLLVLADRVTSVSDEEVGRVVCPLGVVADLRHGAVKTSRIAWPAELDQWTHWLFDASNNAVCADTVVDPPHGLRWTAGPKFARSHEHLASTGAMVTAAGRVFYVIDAGPISSVYLPPEWKLVARDAFSGVLLWERRIEGWASHLRGFRSGPPELPRRLVAEDDRVYLAGALGQPVGVLDAATGEQLFAVAGTRGARELLLSDGVLYVLADDMTEEEHEQRKKWIAGVWPKLEIWYRFPHEAKPIYGRQRILAIRAQSGELIWEQEFRQPGEILPATMAVADGRLCVQTVSHVVCFDAARGTRLWRAPHPVARSRFSWSTPTLVVHDGVVLVADRRAQDGADDSTPAEGSKWIFSSGDSEKQKQPGELVAWSLADGKELWRATCFENYNTQIDVFVSDGVVWVSNLRHGDDPGFTQGRDLKTGRVVATCPSQPGWGHHRCYRNKATPKRVLMGRGGVQFVDLSEGTRGNCPWVRGACQYGVMPANGLVYAPPHSCACVADGMLVGFNALASRSSVAEGRPALVKGPAYGRGVAAGRSPSSGAWPTYRGDARRSAYQDLPAPRRPGIEWTTKLSAPITAPVVADGMVLLAETDRQTVRALSAANGKPLWSFRADGRIDSPPTLCRGACLFGTRNGFVYCLRAADGVLVWRFRAAPCDRRLVSYEQLESVWPVHGSVLVDDQGPDAAATAYVAAGRSSDLDGGVYLHALDVGTGRVLHGSRACTGYGSPDRTLIRKRVMADILSLERHTVWMRAVGMDRNLEPAKEMPHLFAPRGFLDDTWWHRTYWVYGTAVGSGYSNWPTAGNLVPAGRLLAFDGAGLIYGYGWMRYRQGNGHVRPPGAGGYKLFAEHLPDPADYPKDELRAGARASRVPYRRKIEWAADLPFVARAMVLASDGLLVAGGPSLPGAGRSDEAGTLWIASRSDGRRLAECRLPAVPVLDGMAFARLGVFISIRDGSMVCLRTRDVDTASP